MNINDKITLKITEVSLKGDGIGYYKEQKVFVPFTCVGDEIKAVVKNIKTNQLIAHPAEILIPSPYRQTPICKYFGHCGGCSLQHMQDNAYYQFKKNMVLIALAQLKAEANLLQDVVKIGSRQRRRVRLRVAVSKGRILLGFFAAKSHDIVDIVECKTMQKNLEHLLIPLRQTIATLKIKGKIADISLTDTDEGADLLINCKNTVQISVCDCKKLESFAHNNKISRLSISTDDKAELKTVYTNNTVVSFAKAKIALPENAFLQASKKAQDVIISIIKQFLANKNVNKIADLYCGLGCYSFALAEYDYVFYGYESSYDMVMTIHNAAKQNKLAGKVKANLRDLYHNPLNVKEINFFDALIINPPRAGAKQQVINIAKSNIATVIMVSCNLTSFVNDTKHLLNGGYQLKQLVPVDQFYMTPHIELVALFEKMF